MVVVTPLQTNSQNWQNVETVWMLLNCTQSLKYMYFIKIFFNFLELWLFMGKPFFGTALILQIYTIMFVFTCIPFSSLCNDNYFKIVFFSLCFFHCHLRLASINNVYVGLQLMIGHKPCHFGMHSFPSWMPTFLVLSSACMLIIIRPISSLYDSS